MISTFSVSPGGHYVHVAGAADYTFSLWSFFLLVLKLRLSTILSNFLKSVYHEA